MSLVIHFLKSASLAVLLLVQFYFLYSGNFDCLIYDKAGVYVGLLVIFITIPANIWIFSKITFVKNETLQLAGISVAILSIITNGPCFGLWTGKHEKECYEKYGVKTWGFVTSAFNSKGPRMYYEFSVDNKYYTSFNVKNPMRHAYGDSVAVIYNSRCPVMNCARENIEDL